jgi:hypothetical protein
MAKTPRIKQSDLNPVGMIVSAMLTEAQFQALNGTSWILMDGRSVAGSTYAALTGNSVVPDARGMILRGKNNGRSDGNQNPSADRVLGEFENDQMQGHRHQTAAQSGGGGVNIGPNGSGAGYMAIGIANNTNGTTNSTSPIDDSTGNGIPRAGNETRVKNITVNHFIKINY